MKLAARVKLETTEEQSRALLDILKRWDECSRCEGYEGAICEDCGEACEGVRLVPEFAFQGCDACYDGCMAMLAEEAAELLAVAARKLARSGLLVKHVAATLAYGGGHGRSPASFPQPAPGASRWA